MEKKMSALKISGIVAAIIAVIGIIFWIKQLSGGMVQTGMRNYDSWGLYITSFMFFVGLSAGGLIISSIPKAFGIEGFGNISDRKSTRLNSSHKHRSRMPSSA